MTVLMKCLHFFSPLGSLELTPWTSVLVTLAIVHLLLYFNQI